MPRSDDRKKQYNSIYPYSVTTIWVEDVFQLAGPGLVGKELRFEERDQAIRVGRAVKAAYAAGRNTGKPK
jgi:hypothetical protein